MSASRRRLFVAGWIGWALATGVAVAVSATLLSSIVDGAKVDASVVGTFDDPQDRCPDRVEYVVDGTTYDIDVGKGWCSRFDQGSTSPQRVFYDSADPRVAVFADPGGPVPLMVVYGVVVALLLGLVIWLQWWWWRRGPRWRSD